MAEGLFKLAFRRTAALLKLDRPVLALIVAFGTAGLAWWLTGNVAWGGVIGLAFACLIFVPTYIGSLVVVASERFKEGEQKLAEAGAILNAQRDPDGIYQHGRMVGRVTHALVIPAQSLATFAHIAHAEDLDIHAPFEYREWILDSFKAPVHGRAFISGMPVITFQQATARIAGRR